MKIETLPNGNLKITAGEVEQKILKRRGKASGGNWLNLSSSEEWFIETFLEPKGYHTLKDQVACCSAPVFGIGSGESEQAWGFMSYAVESFLELLASGKETIWQKG